MKAKPANKRRATPERDLQRSAIKWLRLVLPAGSIVAANVNEQAGLAQNALSRARFGAARKASGIMPGMPDLTVALPLGRVVFVELKAPGGTVSETQADLHERLWSIGHTVLLADSIETLRHGLHAHGIATREVAGAVMVEPKIRTAKAKRRIPADQVPF